LSRMSYVPLAQSGGKSLTFLKKKVHRSRETTLLYIIQRLCFTMEGSCAVGRRSASRAELKFAWITALSSHNVVSTPILVSFVPVIVLNTRTALASIFIS